MQRVTAVIAEELTKYYDVTIVTFEDPQQKDLKMYDLEKYPINIVFTSIDFRSLCAQFFPKAKARGCG